MPKKTPILSLFAIMFLMPLALVPVLRAQQLTGAITGTVTDSSGARVVGAKIKALNTGTNLTVTAEASKEGAYQIPNLPSGLYTVTCTMNGFKTEERKGILVEGN